MKGAGCRPASTTASALAVSAPARGNLCGREGAGSRGGAVHARTTTANRQYGAGMGASTRAGMGDATRDPASCTASARTATPARTLPSAPPPPVLEVPQQEVLEGKQHVRGVQAEGMCSMIPLSNPLVSSLVSDTWEASIQSAPLELGIHSPRAPVSGMLSRRNSQ